MKPDNKLSVVKDFERAAKETTWEPETLRKIITHPGDRKGDGDRRWPRVMPSDCPPCQRSCRIGEQMNKVFVLFLAAAGKTLRKWLILFFLFVSPTFAQIKTITGGNYQNTNGTPCAGCVLYLQLGTDATVIGTGQVVPSTNAYTLDVNGNVPANSNLWANDQMQPSGLTYKATLTLPGGGQVWGPEFLFISGTSPINLT